MPGSWQPLKNKPNVNIDATLLLADGTVMCHEYLTSNWFRLVPDDRSDYANGTWIPLSTMPNNAPAIQNGPANAPLYFASAVLRDGTVFCAGGEDNGAYNGVDLLAAEIYDPTTDTWTPIATPPKWTNIGDGASCVLPDGRVLLGCANTNFDANATAIWDPESGSWSAGGDGLDSDSEEGWTLLPDGTVLAVQCSSIPNAQKYVIATNSWVSAGVIPVTLPQAPAPIYVPEMGPQILLPDGRVFAIGASGHTALYTPPTTTPTDPGTWAAGPDFPVDSHGNLKAALDAPACLLPNGNVLCCVGAIALSGGDAGFSTPAEFYEFDPISGTLIPAPAPAIAGISPTYNCRLLILPTGQALLSACSDGGASFDMAIYTPSGGPRNAWRPEITHVPHRLHPAHTYRLHGRQLNGLSQACAYGDDQQMATNYPLVRLWGPHHVGAVYCRTFDHSTMGVATGQTIHHTHFAVPDHLPPGEYRLTVIANGISSHPVDVRVERRWHHSHDHDHDHDEEIVEFDHEESKYKDKDAKEAKEKEKDFKDVKEKDTKEFKDKDKDCKECEEKPCKEKDHKECEHKGCKEKECHEHMHYAHHEKRHELGELMHQVGRIAERLEHIEGELHRRPFIRGEERPSVGERALHHEEFERHEHEQHEEERRLHAEEHRRMEQQRLQEEERRRREEERHGAEARSAEPAPRAPENPAATHESGQGRRGPGGTKKR
jgi:Kelch motif